MKTLFVILRYITHYGTVKKIELSIYVVKKIKELTDEDTAKMVYFCYFHSIMCYGLLLWGRAADVETNFLLTKTSNLWLKKSLVSKRII